MLHGVNFSVVTVVFMPMFSWQHARPPVYRASAPTASLKAASVIEPQPPKNTTASGARAGARSYTLCTSNRKFDGGRRNRRVEYTWNSRCHVDTMSLATTV